MTVCTPDDCIRVVHILARYGLGGVETAARSMAAREDLACDFHLLFVAGNTLAVGSPRVVAPGRGSTANPLAHLAVLRRCLALRPDVVIVSLWRSVPLLVALMLLRPSIRRVMTVNSARAAHVVDALMLRVGVAVADEVWGDSAAAIIQRHVTARSRIISFVSDRLPPCPATELRPHFAAWARIDRHKGFDQALELIAALVASGHDARFDLYGPDGGARGGLAAQAHRLGIADRVHFYGPFDRVQLTRIAATASFFLLPSRFEGMAMACVEAMQLGLVPVVTPVGEMAHYVIPGETGILIDPERIEHSAADVAALLAVPDRFIAMRRAAIARWASAPLYADDMCAAANALAQGAAPSRELL